MDEQMVALSTDEGAKTGDEADGQYRRGQQHRTREVGLAAQPPAGGLDYGGAGDRLDDVEAEHVHCRQCGVSFEVNLRIRGIEQHGQPAQTRDNFTQ